MAKAKKALRCAGFLAVLAALLIFLGRVLREKSQEFLSPDWNRDAAKVSDVVLLGPSTIMNGVYPLELWEESGIAAYNFGTGSQSFMASYYLLTDILEQKRPSLVVLDCGKARSGRAIVKIGYLHYLTDRMPALSSSRLDMIRIAAKDRDYTFDEVLGLLVPLYAYHGRWSSLKRSDLGGDYKTITFGAKIDERVRSDIAPFAAYEANPEATLPEISETYLRRIIGLCQSEDIPLLMLTMPNMSVADDVNQAEYEKRVDAAAAVQRIADECGVTHLNLIDAGESVGLVADEDTGDGQHLNYRGARKFTHWLGSYIREHFDVPDRGGDSHYSFLNEKYEAFAAFLAERTGGA